MSELKNLSAILEGGAVPAGYNGKAIGKLSKTYLKLENRKVVNLYPIRTVMHEDSRYCLYACPLKGTEIDEATLQSIKAEVDTLEIGEIRYDSVQSCGYDYYIVDPDTGRHILTGQRDMDSVMEISDHYDGVILFSKSVFSPRKANQLDCAYALIGIEKQPNEFKIEAIPNSAIGQAPTILEFEAPQESPAVEKYRSAMTCRSFSWERLGKLPHRHLDQKQAGFPVRMEGDVVLLPNTHAVPGGQLFVLDRYVAFEDEDVKTVSLPAHSVFIGISL